MPPRLGKGQDIMGERGILNYSTGISVDVTVGEIMGMLARARAKSLQVTYDQGTPAGIEFLIDTDYGDRAFRLPVNIAGVLAALRHAKAYRKIPPRFATTSQAERVAWRIARDWLDVQLAIIDAGMATLTEVMLPYMLMSPNVTLYERLSSQQFPMLGPGREE